MSHRILSGLMLGLLMVSSPSRAASDGTTSYDVFPLVKTGDIIDGKTLISIGAPSLNDAGHVAFIGTYVQGGQIRTGVFTENAFIAGTGTVIGGKTLTQVSGTSINNLGEVAFGASFAGGRGIFKKDAFIVGTGSIIDGRTLTGIVAFPTINNSGTVAFLATCAVCGSGGVFTQHALIAETGSTIGGITLTDILVTPLALNDAGDVGFSSLYSGGAGVFTQNRFIAGTTGTVIDGYPLANFATTPKLNNTGGVAFNAGIQFPPAFYGIFTPNTALAIGSSGLGSSSVIGGKTLLRPFALGGLNDAGVAVFLAAFAGASNSGIFTQYAFVAGPDTEISGFANPLFTNVAINNAGEIAFFVSSFQNGRTMSGIGIARENVPPVTSAIPSPLPNPSGWNNTNVTVLLHATDEPGGSGVKEIQFSLSGAQTAPLQTVLGDAASVVISKEGVTTITYFATDKAGNIEDTKSLLVHIDKTAPVISGMPAPGCTLWPVNQKIIKIATVTATDALSGLAPTSFKLIGTSNEPIAPNDPKFPDILITPIPAGGFEVQLRADRLGTGSDRIYTVTATANDLAGNTSTVTSTCTVPHDQSP
jgi:hypothetical protein